MSDMAGIKTSNPTMNDKTNYFSTDDNLFDQNDLLLQITPISNKLGNLSSSKAGNSKS